MNGDWIDPIVDSEGNPTWIAREVAHLFVGAVAAAAFKQAFPKVRLEAQVLAFAGAWFAHRRCDAPVAKAIARTDIAIREHYLRGNPAV